mmetsp:Transcript_18828/g.47818  ORF Transcript_18828/g.47818 Transcript_18828/m.47818 type:complete len:258 (+) Transcript_18828:511-1284(+)
MDIVHMFTNKQCSRRTTTAASPPTSPEIRKHLPPMDVGETSTTAQQRSNQLTTLTHTRWAAVFLAFLPFAACFDWGRLPLPETPVAAAALPLPAESLLPVAAALVRGSSPSPSSCSIRLWGWSPPPANSSSSSLATGFGLNRLASGEGEPLPSSSEKLRSTLPPRVTADRPPAEPVRSPPSGMAESTCAEGEETLLLPAAPRLRLGGNRVTVAIFPVSITSNAAPSTAASLSWPKGFSWSTLMRKESMMGTAFISSA